MAWKGKIIIIIIIVIVIFIKMGAQETAWESVDCTL